MMTKRAEKQSSRSGVLWNWIECLKQHGSRLTLRAEQGDGDGVAQATAGVERQAKGSYGTKMPATGTAKENAEMAKQEKMKTLRT